MEKLNKKNPEGYMDTTPYYALSNAEKEMFFRGDIFKRYDKNKNEEKYYLIVSANERSGDMIQTVLPLFETKDDKYDDTIEIKTTSGIRYANPKCIQYVNSGLLKEFVRNITMNEMEEIEKGIIDSLGLSIEPQESVVEKVVEKVVEVPVASNVELEKRLVEAQTEARIYKELYMNSMRMS